MDFYVMLSASNQCFDLRWGKFQIINRHIVDVAIPISRTIACTMVSNVKSCHFFEDFSFGNGNLIA